MERELWPRLYRLVMDVGKDYRVEGVIYQPHILLLVLLWAALHDRPRCWACDPRHWSTTDLQPAALPSQSTLSRRLNNAATRRLMDALADRLRDLGEPRLVAAIDAKPLPVGGSSGDPDARCGRAAGLMARGYKLYAVWAGRPMPETYRVDSMNVSENKVAEEMIPELRGGGYLLGDGEYDDNALYDLAGAAGYQLMAPREDNQAGLGHCYQSEYRKRSIELFRGRFGQEVYTQRGAIERAFGNLTSFGGGLSPLPAWVRRPQRVRPWVWAKLLINGMRIAKNQRLTA